MARQSGSSGPPAGGLPDGVMEIVSRSTVPALVLELPSERIVSASQAARDFLSPGSGTLAFGLLAADWPVSPLWLATRGHGANPVSSPRQTRPVVFTSARSSWLTRWDPTPPSRPALRAVDAGAFRGLHCVVTFPGPGVKAGRNLSC
jgi:hypothetical protein